jgi:phage-related protein
VLGAQAVADFLLAVFSPSQVASALASVFSQTAEQVANIFKALNQSLDEIAGVLQGVFNQSAAQVSAFFKSIGETATQIAGVLSSVFGEAVSDVANLLSSIGFSNSTINDIGGAFTSFGKAVENCFSSFFTDC